MLSSLDSPACATPYLVHAPHRTVHLQQRPSTRCHPTPPFVQLVRKPPFAFDSPSLDLAGQVMASSHPVHLAFNDNLLGTTHARVASSCQPLPSDLHAGALCVDLLDQAGNGLEVLGGHQL